MVSESARDIQQLLYQLVLALDENDLELFASYFSTDAELHIDDIEPVYGREAIQSYFSARRERRRRNGERPRHLVSNVIILAEDGSDASSLAYVTGVIPLSGNPPIVTTGWYLDRMRRAQRGWQITRHQIHADNPDRAATPGSPLSDVLSQLPSKGGG